MSLRIEDCGEFIVVEKPHSMHSTGTGKSLESELKEYDPDLILLQRLDFETSGLLLAARGQASFQTLHALQKSGAIEKKYLAITEPVSWQKEQGRVYIWSRYRHSKKVLVSSTEESKRAQSSTTSFLSLQNLQSFSLVRATLTKGLRHQVRAHLGFLGSPLVGDTLYGSTLSFPSLSCSPAFILHANEIVFPDPFRAGAICQFSSEEPDYLKRLVAGDVDVHPLASEKETL